MKVDVGVTADELQAATQADGSLDCFALCSGAGNSVTSCKDLGPNDGGGGSGGTGGSSDGGGGSGGETSGAGGTAGSAPAEPDHVVECIVDNGTYCEGRRHAAVDGDMTGAGPTEVAAWLARAARAEAASVGAFAALAGELEALGAPEALVARTRAAIADEARHARAVGALARAAGAQRTTAPLRSRPVRRSLLDLARENAVEGCVHETFAALVAMHQARYARSAPVRAAFEEIAHDEVRHGELGWAIHRWACSKLDESERQSLEDAMRAASARMAVALEKDELSAPSRASLGLPSAAHASELARALAASLWSTPAPRARPETK